MSSGNVCIKYNENNIPYVDLIDYHIRLENESPSEDVLQKARDELRELPENIAPAVEELRELLKGEPISSQRDIWFLLRGVPVLFHLMLAIRKEKETGDLHRNINSAEHY